MRLEQPGRYRRWAAVLGLAVLLTLLGALASALWYFLAPAIPVRADLHRLRLGRREYTWEEIEELQVDGEGVSVRLTSGAEHGTPRGRTDSAFRGAMHTVWSAVQERYHDVEEEDLEAREAVQALRASEVRTRARRPSKA